MLMSRARDLHATRTTNGWMGDIAISTDLIAGIDDDHSPRLGEDARHFAQHCRLAHTRAAKQQNAMPLQDDIFDNINGPVYGTPNPACQSNDLIVPITNARYSMQRPRNAGSIIIVKFAYAGDYLVDFLASHFAFTQYTLTINVASRRQTTEIQHDLQQPFFLPHYFDALTNILGQD